MNYPHVQAAFINVLREEGTKAELADYLQAQWNESCALRKAIQDALNGPDEDMRQHLEAVLK